MSSRKSRRICIPIEFLPHGGGYYFLDHLAKYLRTIGWQVTNCLKDRYDILFTNHWMIPREEILQAIRYNANVRVVQRIDGSAQDYGRTGDADDRQYAVNLLADVTIFQSEYSRYSTREKFSVIHHDGPIIYNPVDINLFQPPRNRAPLREKTRIACVTWSTNPLKGAASIYAIAEANSEIDFMLCGNYPDAPSLSNLHKLGFLNRDELAAVLGSCHALLTFSQNEACPNHVLEALASGLPVLYYDSGAMAEVVGPAGLSVTEENFASQLNRILNDWEQWSTLARERAVSQFHPDSIFPNYISAMENAIHQPTNIPLLNRLWVAWLDWCILSLRWFMNGIRFSLTHRSKKPE